MSEQEIPGRRMDAFRAMTEEDLDPAYKKARDDLRTALEAVIGRAKNPGEPLPPHVEASQPREGMWQVKLNTAEATSDDSNGFTVVHQDEVAASVGMMGHNAEPFLTVARTLPGEAADSYRTRTLKFMTDGLVKLGTAYEQEIQVGGISTFRPLAAYESAPASQSDIDAEIFHLAETQQLVGLQI